MAEMCASHGLLFSIDFRKAFDQVELCFLWSVLGKMGFREAFTGWLLLLYGSAVSYVAN